MYREIMKADLENVTFKLYYMWHADEDKNLEILLYISVKFSLIYYIIIF